mgnify:CR=1 FL=1
MSTVPRNIAIFSSHALSETPRGEGPRLTEVEKVLELHGGMIWELRKDVTGLKQDMISVRQDMISMRQDIAKIVERLENGSQREEWCFSAWFRRVFGTDNQTGRKLSRSSVVLGQRSALQRSTEIYS